MAGVRVRRAIRSKTRQTQIATMRKARSELLAVLEAEAALVKADYEDAVSDWSDENRPQFVTERKLTDKELKITIRPYARRKASQVFSWVDLGTRPHVIRPKKSNPTQRLAFQTGYRPKTLPVAQAHVGPGRAEGNLTRPMIVHHPGTAPRQFTKVFQKRSQSRLSRAVEAKFRELARRMNR